MFLTDLRSIQGPDSTLPHNAGSGEGIECHRPALGWDVGSVRIKLDHGIAIWNDRTKSPPMARPALDLETASTMKR